MDALRDARLPARDGTATAMIRDQGPAVGGFARALAAALLFGAATPASKPLVDTLGPLGLAGLLYLGAALGVLPVALRGEGLRALGRLDRGNAMRLSGAVFLGGVAGPLLLLSALSQVPAASVSLASGLEGPFTALLGVAFFHDVLGPRGWLGVVSAGVATALLASGEGYAGALPVLLVVAACLCWGLDNHLTALLDGLTPAAATLVKGLVAGTTNLVLAGLLAPPKPGIDVLGAALAIGALGYGMSITLYVTAAQEIGATRAQAVFAAAPFLGALLAFVGLGEPVTAVQLGAGALFAVSLVLLLGSSHTHAHAHPAVEHVHAHRHDDGHHDHEHPGLPLATRHVHRHRHEAHVHEHPHQPDLHHRHPHGGG